MKALHSQATNLLSICSLSPFPSSQGSPWAPLALTRAAPSHSSVPLFMPLFCLQYPSFLSCLRNSYSFFKMQPKCHLSLKPLLTPSLPNQMIVKFIIPNTSKYSGHFLKNLFHSHWWKHFTRPEILIFSPEWNCPLLIRNLLKRLLCAK